MAQLSLMMVMIQRWETQLRVGLISTATTTIVISLITPITTINIPVTRISRYISKIQIRIILLTITITPTTPITTTTMATAVISNLL